MTQVVVVMRPINKQNLRSFRRGVKSQKVLEQIGKGVIVFSDKIKLLVLIIFHFLIVFLLESTIRQH